jgi:cytidine diphosphoramidate kinase
VATPDAAGWVFWLTGLPASGKTTLATLLVSRLRARHMSTVLLDGDVLREVFEHDLGYSLEDRRRCARRYARLGRMLAAQGVQVVTATISLFEDVRHWNRTHVDRYVEVYVRAPAAVRAVRDRDRGRAPVAYDVPFEEPATPDLVLDNDGSAPAEEVVERLWTHVLGRLGRDAD